MAENTSKFIFTREGSRLLVSQTGGIKFAILGYMLIEGLAGEADPSALCAGGLEARWKQIEEEADNAKMSTIEYLTTQKTNMTFIMKNVPYIYAGTDGSPNGYVAPANIDEYREALANYKKNLYGTFYIPSTETQDTNGNHYGSYAFNFDRTNLNCKIDKENGINIRHILVIGKQYAENKDATFNVNERQDASIVGVAEIVNTDGYGIQILPGQNDFVTFQCQLRFTVCPHINEDLMAETEIFIGDNGDYTEVYEEVSDIASKLALVNNGLKTLSGGITIGQNKEILDELQLGPDGAICMTKTLMVADCVDASDAENQFNAAALIHPINKYPTDGGEYVPQVLMTTGTTITDTVTKIKNDLQNWISNLRITAGADRAIPLPYKVRLDTNTFAREETIMRKGNIISNEEYTLSEHSFWTYFAPYIINTYYKIEQDTLLDDDQWEGVSRLLYDLYTLVKPGICDSILDDNNNITNFSTNMEAAVLINKVNVIQQ